MEIYNCADNALAEIITPCQSYKRIIFCISVIELQMLLFPLPIEEMDSSFSDVYHFFYVSCRITSLKYTAKIVSKDHNVRV